MASLESEAEVRSKPGAKVERAYPQPLFILAAPRSFSSVVAAMIGCHPELYGVPELNLFQCRNMDEFITGENPDWTKKSPFWKVMRHGLLRTVAELYGGEQTIESVAMAERWVEARRDLTSSEVFRELCARAAPYRIVEKSPAYVRKREYLDRILATFPHARFIHLVRHPRGQCNSMLKAKGGVGVLMSLNAIDTSGVKPQLEPQIVWHDVQVQILNFLEPLPRKQWRTVRGEDLLNDTDRSLAKLCRWLGISRTAKALAAMKQPELSPYACVGPANAWLGNDINFLRSPGFRKGGVSRPRLDGPLDWRTDGRGFYPEVQALARELGYD